MSQNDRERKLDNFRKGRYSVMVATDVAARGLDIPNVDLVLHYELPGDTESFLHRYLVFPILMTQYSPCFETQGSGLLDRVAITTTSKENPRSPACARAIVCKLPKALCVSILKSKSPLSLSNLS